MFNRVQSINIIHVLCSGPAPVVSPMGGGDLLGDMLGSPTSNSLMNGNSNCEYYTPVINCPVLIYLMCSVFIALCISFASYLMSSLTVSICTTSICKQVKLVLIVTKV